MKVYFTENAIEHLVNIYDYISLNSPTYAKRMVDKITRRSEQISVLFRFNIVKRYKYYNINIAVVTVLDGLNTGRVVDLLMMT